jgi:hypothetical protein
VVGKRRAEDDYFRATAEAWQVAALTVQAMNGHLPKLATLLERRRQAGDLRTQLEAVSKVVGIPLRPATPAAVVAFRRPKESSP